MSDDAYAITLQVTKYLSLAASTIIGVLGTAFETRDVHKKLNRWGVSALVGIVLSGLLGTISQKLEADLQATEAAQRERSQRKMLTRLEDILTRSASAQAQQQQILDATSKNVATTEDVLLTTQRSAADIRSSIELQSDASQKARELLVQSQRQLTPLEPITVSYTLIYPCNVPEFKAYFARLRSEGHEYGPMVEYGSPQYPDMSRPDEEDAYTMLTYHSVWLKFFRPVERPGRRTGRVGLSLRPPLLIDDGAGAYGTLHTDMSSDCDRIEQHVSFRSFVNDTPVAWATIVSRVDLVDSELWVQLSKVLPIDTRLEKVYFWFGSAKGSPITISFTDSERRICCPGVQISPPLEWNIGYRKVITAREVMPSF